MKGPYNLLFPLVFFLLMILPTSSATIAPNWVQEGVFCEYTFESAGVLFVNGTTNDFCEHAQANFNWTCVELNGEIAKVKVSLSFKNSNETIEYSTELKINVNTKDLFLINSTIIGKTRIWSTANPSEKEEIVLSNFDSNTNSNKISAVAKPTGTSRTPQGYQKSYSLIGTGKLFGENYVLTGLYDFDTGVLIDGSVDCDPTLIALGIKNPMVDGRFIFEATNINLGQREIWPEIASFLFLTPAIIVISVTTLIVHRLRIKGKRKYRFKHS